MSHAGEVSKACNEQNAKLIMSSYTISNVECLSDSIASSINLLIKFLPKASRSQRLLCGLGLLANKMHYSLLDIPFSCFHIIDHSLQQNEKFNQSFYSR